MTAPHPRGCLQAAYKECRVIARRSAGNFYYAFLVLPRKQRQGMEALYAFARRTDDMADSVEPESDRRLRLQEWRRRLVQTLAGDERADGPLWALADVVNRYSISHQLFHGLIDGVESDLGRVRMATFADLYHYSYQVASTVGLACIRIWGVRDGAADLPAERCGVAMQLTNILRDLREDYHRGRIYLPADEMARYGVEPAALGERIMSPELRRLVAFQILRAHDYYDRSAELFSHLPPTGRSVLRVMIDIYRGLLRVIERRPERILRGRVALSAPRKLALTLRGLI